MTLRSVWNNTTPNGTIAYYTDGFAPAMWSAQTFTLTGGFDIWDDPSVQVVGARLYFPPGVSTNKPAQVTLGLWLAPVTSGGANTAKLNMAYGDPIQAKTRALVDGWNEVTFDVPQRMPRVGHRVLIGYHFPDQPLGYVYGATLRSAGAGNPQMAVDGYPLAWPEWTASLPVASDGQVEATYYWNGSNNYVQSSAVQTNSTFGYGIDIVISTAEGNALAVGPDNTVIDVNMNGWWNGSTNASVELAGWWDGAAIQPLATVDRTPPGGATPVRFTTTGSTFNPAVILTSTSTATVHWTVEETSEVYAGLSPTIDFGSAGTRHVQMMVSEIDGTNRMNQVRVINIGYDSSDDVGNYMAGIPNHPAQQVVAVENVNSCSMLSTFAAAHTPLSGTVDFSGCSNLQFIECYDANIAAVNLTGCTGLSRLVLELNSLSALDLDPVAANIYDCRFSTQDTGRLVLTLSGPLVKTYHWCVHDQVLVNSIDRPGDNSWMPNITQLWDWITPMETGVPRSGNFVAPPKIQNLSTFGNGWTSADLSNRPTLHDALMQNCPLTTVDITGSTQCLYWNFSGAALTQACVDDLLTKLDAAGLGAGGGESPYLYLNGGTSAAPSATGASAKANLIARGWDVQTN